MKSIKYFAALAFPAMLAACANEEIQVERPQAMKEVVGAEFIGTDISMIASKGNAGSRFAGGDSDFDEEDKLGLGWIVVNNGPSQSQTSAGKFYNNKLYANHLFEYVKGESNTFTTKSNIYKGYHFAYYPYTYMEEVDAKTIEISPKQKVGYLEGATSFEAHYQRFAQRFQMSALQFLTKESLDPDTYQLVQKFDMRTPLSHLVVKTTAEGSFATNENLKTYDIKSVSFDLGKEVFAQSAELDVTKLHKLSADMTDAENEEALLASFAKVLKPGYYTTVDGNKTWNVGRLASAKTEVEVASYKVSANQPRLITYVLPMDEPTAFTEEEAKLAKIEVEAGGGKFVIDYTPNAEEESAADTNNKALEALVAAYSTDGLFVAKTNQNVVLDIVLTEADFVADFTGVTNDNWAEKVQLANDLNRGVETFTLAKGANVIFEGKNLDAEGNMLAPKAGVIVNTVEDNPSNGTLTIEGNTVWNENIDINTNRVTLEVSKDATLEVNSVLAPSRINNYGTISALAQAEVGKIWNNEGYLFNYGRVDVTYGAFVNVNSTAKGIIAYTLNASDVENPSIVKELIATSTNKYGHANVNTLVINKPIDIDLYKNVDGTTGSTEEGRYNDKVTDGSDATGAYWIENLAAVSLEINEGIVKASYAPVKVANVTMTGGTINNIEISGKLTIKGGHNNVNVNDHQKIGSVEIKGGENTIHATEITTVVETVKGRNAIHAEKIGSDLAVNGEHHEIVVATLKNVEVTGSAVISNSNIDGDLTVNSGTTKMENVNISGTLTNNGTVVIDSTEEFVTIGNIKNSNELTANTDVIVKTIELIYGSKTTVNKDNTIWYTIPKANGGYKQDGTTTGKIEFYGAQWASTIEELQSAIDAAVEGDNVILFGGDIAGDLTVSQNPNVKIVIDGRNHEFNGAIIVDGKSSRYETAALSINNVNFRETTAKDAFINLGDGTDATRYTNNVTVDGCTFDGEGEVAIKSYTGGDKNLKINNCVVSENCHSLLQITNVEEGLEISNCQVYSKNGANLNSTPAMVMDKCTFDVRGYAVRLGVNGTVGGETKAFEIKNSSLKSACEEDEDAVIIFRDNAKKATLTLENTSVTGTKVYLGNEVANIVVK